ncbi:MAG: hypothetical protein JFR41_06205 [Muribaculaceae bacterium]|nr:hypothetical protein [Muribaculaceae bacterium]
MQSHENATSRPRRPFLSLFISIVLAVLGISGLTIGAIFIYEAPTDSLRFAKSLLLIIGSIIAVAAAVVIFFIFKAQPFILKEPEPSTASLHTNTRASDISLLATICLIAGAILLLYATMNLSNPLASFPELAFVTGCWLINIGVSLLGGLTKNIDSESKDQSADKPRMGFMMKLIVFVAYLSFPTLLITIFTIILKSGDVVAIPRLMNCFTFSLMVMITSGAICTGRAIANKLNS